MSRSRLLAAVTVVVSALTACLNDAPVVPNASGVRLRLNAVVVSKGQAAAADRTVGIRVFYRRGSGDAMTEVDLPVDPQRITVPPGATTQQEVTVTITPCLADAERVGGPGCHFSVQLALLDADGGTLSQQTQDVDAGAAGETVNVPQITLKQAEIALTQSAITFTAEEQSTPLPAAVSVGISSVTGVSLGTLTATPAFGSNPTNWLNVNLAADGSSVSIQPNTTNLPAGVYSGTVTVASSRSAIQAKTVNITYTITHKPQPLTISGAGGGSGRVVSTPAGIDCTVSAGAVSGTCQANFPFGAVVTLTPTPAATSDFTGFTGACTGATCQVTVDQAQNVTATFQLKKVNLSLTIVGTGNGSVTSSPNGINCTVTNGAVTGTCTASFDFGTQVTLTPTPAANSNFTAFSGACTGATCQVTMDQARSVTATFTLKNYRLTVVDAGTGDGTVTSNPSGINCTITGGVASGNCLIDLTAGSGISLTATPAANSNFTGFTGACTGTTCQLTMDQPKSVTASFALKTFTLTVAAGGGNGRIVSTPAGVDCTINGTAVAGACVGTFNYGTQLSLAATPASGQVLYGYSGDCAGTTCQLTMTQAHAVTATFGGGVFFSDDFEKATNWTATGFWNRINLAASQVVNTLSPTYVTPAPNDTSKGRLPLANSGSYSFWYGDVKTGSFVGVQIAGDGPKSGGRSTASNSGTLTSPSFTIAAGAPNAAVSFAYWYEIEGEAPASFDLMQVYAVDPATGQATFVGRVNPATATQAAPDVPYTSAGPNLAPIWTSTTLDLSPFIGKTIQLQFNFNTGDTNYNGFRGWIIDDVVVMTQPVTTSILSKKVVGGTPKTAITTFPVRTPVTNTTGTKSPQ